LQRSDVIKIKCSKTNRHLTTNKYSYYNLIHIPYMVNLFCKIMPSAIIMQVKLSALDLIR